MRKVSITHPGIIKQIKNGKAQVSIIVNSGCASCEVKNSCNISEAKEKVIEVTLSHDENYKEGQPVRIEMKQSMGNWAVLLGYFIPFLLVLAALIIFTSSGIDEGLSAILSLITLGPYYLILFLTKNKLSKSFTYHMEPQNQEHLSV